MTNFTDIRDFLRAHCARYPELALQDVFKALYQSAFGCEHLIADPSAAADYIRAEAARSGDRISELVELLGGDYCRVHLGILQDGLSAETFARLFALSARHEECGREKLEAMLTALQTMADAGELPFSAQETAEAVERWRKDGFPPLHHSEIFRQNYAPAYRVLRRDFARALPLFARIDRLTAERSRVLVAIEGGSASGKTTLGELLQNVYGCPVFHMDDFFLRPEQRTEARFAQPGGNVDRERFLEEVLIPLREGRPVDYRRFDCATFTIAPPQRIKAGTLNIVEGADLVVSATTSPHFTLTAEQTAALSHPPRLLLDLAMPRDIESAAASGHTALFNLDDLGELGDADNAARETALRILDEETREFFAWLNYRAALPLIAQLKSAVASRVRHIRDYDALVADGDAETLAELAANRAVELVLGGMKQKIDVETMKACLEHIGKGSGR